jgi:hypothetical protein
VPKRITAGVLVTAFIALLTVPLASPAIASTDADIACDEASKSESAAAASSTALAASGTTEGTTADIYEDSTSAPNPSQQCVKDESVCTLDVSNTFKEAGYVKAIVSIACNDVVDSIHVQGHVTRTTQAGKVFLSPLASKICIAKRYCQVVPRLEWVAAPNDLWHAWGKGWVQFTPNPESKCHIRGRWIVFGVAGYFRSDRCNEHPAASSTTSKVSTSSCSG